MNRSLALSLFLGSAIIAGILLLFPSLWTLLLLLLLGLVSGLVILVRRHLTVHRVLTPETPWPGSKTATDNAPAAGAAAEAEGALDSSLFSRFRERLEEAETPAAQPAAPVPDYDTPEGVTDRVNLSSAARRGGPAPKSAQGAAPAPGKPVSAAAAADAPAPGAPAPPTESRTALAEEELEVDIFDDLRTDPAAIVAGKPPPAATPPAPPPEERLEVPPGAPSAESTADDAPALLHMAEDALTRGDLSGARAGLNNYFSAMAGHEAEIPWQAHLARLRLSVADGKPEAVLEHFEQMLGRGFTPEQETLADTFDAWLKPLADESAAPLRVSLLVRALACFRQAGDRAAMDRTYRQIAAAQEAAGDERKLVQFLKNHLKIKKVMGDQEGQLELIDQIGNRLYRLGETEEAKTFYEQGLTLRARLEGDTAPGITDTDTPPPVAAADSPGADSTGDGSTGDGSTADGHAPADAPLVPRTEPPPKKDDA